MKLEHCASVPLEVAGEPVLAVHSIVRADDGSVYLSDEFNNRLIIFSGGFSKVVGQKGSEPGNFWYPRGLTLVSRGEVQELFVCDSWMHRIERFSTDGEFLGEFGSMGDGDDKFYEPVMAIADDDALFILDRCNHRIVKRDFDGKPIGSIGRHMTRTEEDWINDPVDFLSKPLDDSSFVLGLNYPSAFTRDPAGDFLVADTGNRRICRIAPDGRFKQIITLDTAEPPFFYPVSIIYTHDDMLLVESSDNRIKLLWGERHEYCDDIEMPLRSNSCRLISGSEYNGERKSVISFCDNSLISHFIPGRPATNKPAVGAEIASTTDDIRSVPLIIDQIISSKIDHQEIEKYLAFLRKSVELAGNSIQSMQKLEQEYCNLAKAYFERYISHKISSSVQAGTNIYNDHEMTKLHFHAVKSLETRKTERRIFTETLAACSKLLCFLRTKTTEDSLIKEEGFFKDTLKKEFDDARADYDRTILIFKEKLADIGKVDLGSVLVACIGLLILHNYMRIFSGIVALIASPAEKENLQVPTLPGALSQFDHDMRRLPSNTLFVLGAQCEEWGYFSAAGVIYEGLIGSRDEAWQVTGLIHLSHVKTAGKKFNESLDLLKKAEDLSDRPSMALLVELCEAHFRLGELEKSLKKGRELYELVRNDSASPFYISAIIYNIQPLIFMGDFDKVDKFLSSLPSLRDIPEIFHFRSALYQLHYEEKSALDNLRRLVEENPNVNILKRSFAIRLGLAGHKGEALDYIGQEEKQSPDIVNTMIKSGTHRFDGEHEKALSILKDLKKNELGFLPVTMEYLVNVYALKKTDKIDEAVASAAKFCRDNNYFSNYIHIPKSQEPLVQEVLTMLQGRLREDGTELKFFRLNNFTYQYTISHNNETER